MDARAFDRWTATVVRHQTRRGIVRAIASSVLLAGLGPPFGLDNTEAKRNRKKKKRKKKLAPTLPPQPSSCTPNCIGKNCGDDGCGGSCGACGNCEQCQNGACVSCSAMGTSCQGGVCIPCGGSDEACCFGTMCEGGLKCTVEQKCGQCGGSFEVCCFGHTCQSGHCTDRGFCADCGGPFAECCWPGSCIPGFHCCPNVVNVCMDGPCS